MNANIDKQNDAPKPGTAANDPAPKDARPETDGGKNAAADEKVDKDADAVAGTSQR